MNPLFSLVSEGGAGYGRNRMQSPRTSIFLYAAVVSALSLYCLWVGLIFAHKVICWFHDMNEPMSLLPIPAHVMAMAPGMFELFWPVCLVLFVVMCLGFSPLRWSLIRSVARIFTIIASVLLFVGFMTLAVSVFMATHDAYFSQCIKTHTFSRVLEEFALRESAEGRFAQMQARMAVLMSLKPVQIKSAEEMPRSERRQRAAATVKYLQETKSPVMQKKALATALWFRVEIAQNERWESAILAAANALTEQSFKQTSEFFDWISSRLNTEGWEPIPLCRFEPSKKSEAE